MPQDQLLFMTWEEYLNFEEKSPCRHEYVNGAVYEISSESVAHNRIARELVVVFGSHLHGQSCEPFFLAVHLEIRAGSDRIMYYPDAMVSCRPEDCTENTVRNPKLVVEILSKSTEQVDRREKALVYQGVETIEEYAAIADSRPRVIVHRRSEGWRPTLYAGPAAVVEFRSIGLSVPLARIYQGW